MDISKDKKRGLINLSAEALINDSISIPFIVKTTIGVTYEIENRPDSVTIKSIFTKTQSKIWGLITHSKFAQVKQKNLKRSTISFEDPAHKFTSNDKIIIKQETALPDNETITDEKVLFKKIPVNDLKEHINIKDEKLVVTVF